MCVCVSVCVCVGGGIWRDGRRHRAAAPGPLNVARPCHAIASCSRTWTAAATQQGSNPRSNQIKRKIPKSTQTKTLKEKSDGHAQPSKSQAMLTSSISRYPGSQATHTHTKPRTPRTHGHAPPTWTRRQRTALCSPMPPVAANTTEYKYKYKYKIYL